MKIEYHPGLVEQAVCHAVHGVPKLEAELHRQTDRLYDDPPSKDRDARFVRAYGDFFEQLNLDGTLLRLLDERPVIAESVRACIVGPAPRASNTFAELLVRGQPREVSRDDRLLTLQVSPPTLAAPELFARRMRPELFHIADMVDPAFRYQRQHIEGLPARRNLIRDRYRVLWDIYIDGRLEPEGHSDGGSRPRMLALLARVFGIEPGAATSRAFARVFGAESLTHQQLFAWANAPEDLFGPGTDVPKFPSGAPGATCPLCGFSTFDWFVFDPGTDSDLVRAIERHDPSWIPAGGACRQCVEIYASLAGAALARAG